ncbi:MAG TPA: ATP-dependent DNA ligase [Actinomycetota bacterium]|nr:ATP-dependent DNA ligase [Actinomycetota bacterium]
MDAPVRPPVRPMLARLARELPTDGFVYEPKWDGFRCLAFRDGGRVDLRSRNDRPLARYFPEIVEAMTALPEERFVLDGELILVTGAGFDFPALLTRLHPAASRVERLRRETPSAFVAFDALAVGVRDLRTAPFVERRAVLEALLRDAGPPLYVTPATRERSRAAEWLERFQGAGIDGVVAKDPRLPYREGQRAIVKVKRERTADCVVAGFRTYVEEPVVASLLLGVYDRGGLRHVGVASSFSEAMRSELLAVLRPLIVPIDRHPWRDGFAIDRNPIGRLAGSAGTWTPDMELDWIPVRPELVCEVAFDQVDRARFRHPARFRRWRPDLDPQACTLEQLEASASPVADMLGEP